MDQNMAKEGIIRGRVDLEILVNPDGEGGHHPRKGRHRDPSQRRWGSFLQELYQGEHAPPVPPNGSVDIMQIVILKGLDVSDQEEPGNVPLTITIETSCLTDPLPSNFAKASKTLLNSGSNVNVAPKEGNPAIVITADIDDTQIIRTMIKKMAKADIDARDENGQTALHIAAAYFHYKVIEELLAKGAEVDPIDDLGNTPLYSACLVRGGRRVIRMLLESGADHQHKGQAGTCTEVAFKTRKGHIENLVPREEGEAP
jgi:ankyrin repeat protein